MFRQMFNWRTVLALIAIFIVSGTIFYSQYLARKIAKEERLKVEQWIKASQFILTSPPDADLRIASMIVTENTSIPIIETNENDSVTQHINLDSAKATNLPYVEKKLKQFKSQHKAIEWPDPNKPAKKNL